MGLIQRTPLIVAVSKKMPITTSVGKAQLAVDSRLIAMLERPWNDEPANVVTIANQIAHQIVNTTPWRNQRSESTLQLSISTDEVLVQYIFMPMLIKNCQNNKIISSNILQNLLIGSQKLRNFSLDDIFIR